jgi:hypothetical protein
MPCSGFWLVCWRTRTALGEVGFFGSPGWPPTWLVAGRHGSSQTLVERDVRALRGTLLTSDMRGSEPWPTGIRRGPFTNG